LAALPGEGRVAEGADLFAALGATAGTDGSPAHAAAAWYGARGDPAAGPAFVHLDPVHLQIALDGSYLTDPRELALQPEEVAELTGLLNDELFIPEGGTLYAVRPDTWLLALPEPPDIATLPPQACLGGDARRGLPGGPDGPAWQRRLNEAQMLLAGSRANRERERLGLPTVNSLWPWGSGRVPEVPSRRFATVLGGGLAAAGLARLGGSLAGSCPPDYWQWRDQARGGRDLVVWDEARAARVHGGPGEGVAALEQLDREWLGPAWADLKAGRLGGLHVVLGAADAGEPGKQGANAGLVLSLSGGVRLPRPRRCPVGLGSARGAPVAWSELGSSGPASANPAEDARS
jgi:hypothetical protein